MSNIKKLMVSAGGAPGLDVAEVFSIDMWKGTEVNDSIVNNIDLSGEGGLVWVKNRGTATYHTLIDTVRGANKDITSNGSDPEEDRSGFITGFNSDGYNKGTNARVNNNNYRYCGWTFRKAPKFFDIVTYTGNSTAGRTISHNLGATPAFIFVKCRNVGEAWSVYYGDNTKDLRLDSNQDGTATSNWNNTSPTDTNFTLGSNSEVNGNNNTYVAYLFASNDGDGGFGPNGDQDIIKCGSATFGSDKATVDLDFEPQYILIKSTSVYDQWRLVDAMRNLNHDVNMDYSRTGSYHGILYPNLSNGEADGEQIWINEKGFSTKGMTAGTYSYIAIRRGPLFPPTDATDVFSIDTFNTATLSSIDPSFTSNDHIVDFAIQKVTDQPFGWKVHWRLSGYREIQPNDKNEVNQNASGADFRYNNGYFRDGAGDDNDYYAWMWRRQAGYLDTVQYTGTSSNHTITHNLGVEPEMIWIKSWDTAYDWNVYVKSLGISDYLYLNYNIGKVSNQTNYYQSTPTDTSFTIGTSGDTNNYGKHFVAFLFASVPGVSKIGSYTGNGSSQTINCGFSAGARFVLIKRTDSTGDWLVYDTARGINAGDDPRLFLNKNNVFVSDTDSIDAHASGFSVNNDGNFTNASGASYIFYAVA
jgi:hypothetical protein